MSAADTGVPQALAEGEHTLDLGIGGMTCASCAARIEKKLNRVDGVTASVNYATEKARVTFPASLAPERLVSVGQGIGYTATLPPRPVEQQATAAPDVPPQAEADDHTP